MFTFSVVSNAATITTQV